MTKISDNSRKSLLYVGSWHMYFTGRGQVGDQFESSDIRTGRSFIYIDQVEISNIRTGLNIQTE